MSDGGGYDPAYFADLARVEDRHFWFRARNRVLARLVGGLIRTHGAGARILEIGCGTGNVLRVLEQSNPGGTVVGVDLFAEGLRFARARTGCPLVRADVRRSPFGARFHIIGMFDVLEHIPDDLAVLRDVRALLEPGGALVLTTPAHQRLWSYFDEAGHHCRRYERAELTEKLTRAGYRVEFVSEYMALNFPLLWMHRKLAPRLLRRRDGEDAHERSMSDLKIVPVLNELLAVAMAVEGPWLARGWRLPIGTSLVAIARLDA